MYDIGDKVTLTAEFRNQAGALTDPTEAACRIKRPDGTVTVLAIGDLTRLSLGKWTHDVVIDQAGVWHYRFESTGNIQTAGEDRFRVRESAIV